MLIAPAVRFIRSLFADSEAEIEYITKFTFDSAYSLIQGKEGAFLAACTKALKVATCIFVHPGSVVLGVKHAGDEAAAIVKNIKNYGMSLPTFFPKPLVPISSGNSFSIKFRPISSKRPKVYKMVAMRP